MSWFYLGVWVLLGYIAYKIWQSPTIQDKIKNVEE